MMIHKIISALPLQIRSTAKQMHPRQCLIICTRIHYPIQIVQEYNNQYIQTMNAELMAAIKQRGKKMGVVDEKEQKKQPIKVEHSLDTQDSKAKLEAFFGKKNNVPVPQKKTGDVKLPPPPSLNLPPPPPPPSLNLPPPPPPPSLNLPSPSTLPPPPSLSSNLPPPPPPPSFQQPTYTPPPREPSYKQPQQPSYNPPPPRQPSYKPREPSYHPQPPRQPSYKPREPSYHQQQQSSHYQKVETPPQQEPCFILTPGSRQTKPPPPSFHEQKTSSIPQISEWKQNELQSHKKKRIFDRKSLNKQSPLTQQFFGRDIAALIKKQFIKEAPIFETIDTQIKKNMFSFHFPSIENKIRSAEPIETLYADTNNLDLVSCYMNKNLNVGKIHEEARQNFINSFKHYDWGSDAQKLKPIREAANQIPSLKYQEPNFVQIKNAISRSNDIINTLIKHQQFNRCAEVKQLKDETERLVTDYCKHPDSNSQNLDKIEFNVGKLKNLSLI